MRTEVGQGLPVASERAQRLWETLKDTAAERPYDQYEQKADYWMEVLTKARSVFWEFLRLPPEDKELAWFLDQFGRHGPQADFRILFCDPHLTLPEMSPWGVWPLDEQKHGISGDEFHRIRIRICSAQIQMLAADAERLQRYYQAVLWTRTFLKPGISTSLAVAVDRTAKGFKQGELGDNPWCVRNFLVLAAATGRQDLVRGLDMAKVAPAWNTWHTWYAENGSALGWNPKTLTWRPGGPAGGPGQGAESREAPKHPFADWRGPPPPSPQLIYVYASSVIPY